VQPSLMNVGQHAEERIGKAPAKSSRGLEGKGNGRGGFHDEVSGAFTGKVQNRGLPGKHAAFGGAHNRREAAAAPGFDALVAEAHLVRGGAPRARSRAILWTACLLLRTTGRATLSSRGRWRRNADIGEGVHEPGIDGQSLARGRLHRCRHSYATSLGWRE